MGTTVHYTFPSLLGSCPHTHSQAHTRGLALSVLIHFLLVQLNSSVTQRIQVVDLLEVSGNRCQPQCVVWITEFVCVDHCLSLLQCMTAPCRHSLYTTSSRYQRRLVFRLISFYWKHKSETKMWFHCVCIICTLQSALGRCHVWCRPHLQSFRLCSPWHDIDIVLSIPTLELVSKSRFNLHASCLQEEEVEEFRVSLSWYWFPSISFWASRNEIFPAPTHPPPPP